MTNEQTAIMLNGIIARLQKAIDDAGNLMPEGATREESKRHTAPGCLGFACDYAPHYETVPGDYVALLPLRELLESLEDESRLLKAAA